MLPLPEKNQPVDCTGRPTSYSPKQKIACLVCIEVTHKSWTMFGLGYTVDEVNIVIIECLTCTLHNLPVWVVNYLRWQSLV